MRVCVCINVKYRDISFDHYAADIRYPRRSFTTILYCAHHKKKSGRSVRCTVAWWCPYHHQLNHGNLYENRDSKTATIAYLLSSISCVFKDTDQIRNSMPSRCVISQYQRRRRLVWISLLFLFLKRYARGRDQLKRLLHENRIKS